MSLPPDSPLRNEIKAFARSDSTDVAADLELVRKKARSWGIEPTSEMAVGFALGGTLTVTAIQQLASYADKVDQSYIDFTRYILNKIAHSIFSITHEWFISLDDDVERRFLEVVGDELDEDGED